VLSAPPSPQLFKDTLYIDQRFYPERLERLFLINAPWIFKVGKKPRRPSSPPWRLDRAY
jgi:hypothetical protein